MLRNIESDSSQMGMYFYTVVRDCHPGWVPRARARVIGEYNVLHNLIWIPFYIRTQYMSEETSGGR